MAISNVVDARILNNNQSHCSFVSPMNQFSDHLTSRLEIFGLFTEVGVSMYTSHSFRKIWLFSTLTSNPTLRHPTFLDKHSHEYNEV